MLGVCGHHLNIVSTRIKTLSDRLGRTSALGFKKKGGGGGGGGSSVLIRAVSLLFRLKQSVCVCVRACV